MRRLQRITREGSGAIAARKRRAEGKRNLAKYRARDTPAEPSFDAVDRLNDFDLAREDGVKCALASSGTANSPAPR
jgi:hypothetical protein